MDEKTTNIELVEEKSQGVPAGATILRKNVSMVVKKIKNGYLLEKRYDVKYSLKGSTEYTYWTDIYYSAENPIEIKEKIGKKDLIDKF